MSKFKVRRGWMLAMVLALSVEAGLAAPAADKIVNDCFWYTVDGNPIYSQGGGIFSFPDPASGRMRYYWYGVRYQGAESYLQDPSLTIETSAFRSVTCYSSDDLVNWRFEGDVLTAAALEQGGGEPRGWVGRLGVAYIGDIGKYALCVQHSSFDPAEQRCVLIALADAPNGEFVWHNWFSMKDMIGTRNTGDQTVFTDPDTGKSYLVYSYGRGRNRIYLSEIGLLDDGKVGLLNCRQIFRGAGREGNCMFKYRGKYYMCASDLYGWDSSHAYYLVADSIYGPYLPKNNMLVMPGCSADYAHVSQTGFFVTLRGSSQETVIFCGDRWADFAGNGLGYNQWVPISFTNDGQPFFNSLSAWHLDAGTGQWRVADDNNYVRNGSFEADRRPVPNPVKPRQDWLSGWQTRVLQGHSISNDSLSSPRLNYLNTRDDRRFVVGEKSLNIADSVAFERVVSQQIDLGPFAPLPDGDYLLRAMVYLCPQGKADGRFLLLEMYAQSSGQRFSLDLTALPCGQWQAVSLPVTLRGGQAEIGFHAQGQALATCRIDDVSLVKAAR